MWFPLSLRHSCLLVYYSLMLGYVIIGSLLVLLFAVWYDTSTCLILMWHLHGFIYVRTNWLYLRGWKPLDMRCSYFPVIFNLRGGQKLTPLFVGYCMIILAFILQFILHGCRESVLSGNANVILREFFVAEFPICLIALPALLLRCR